MTARQGRIRIGTAGWSYPDWEGIVYPRRPRPADELRYLAGFFDVLEVNSSFYRPPPPRTTASWLRRTADLPDFRFTFKMHQRFTHQRQTAWTPAEADEIRSGIEPVAAAGRLGAVLLQFPWSFRAEAESHDWLRRLVDEFGRWPLVVEVRHDSWARPELRELLGGLGVSLASIDQPQLGHCLPPGDEALGPLGYVRLHGRNAAKWFAADAEASERYNYMYNDSEINEWVARIRRLAGQRPEVYVIANNHFRGQAPANALQLLARIEGRRVPAPAPLVEHYPFLEQVAASTDEQPGGQGSLF